MLPGTDLKGNVHEIFPIKALLSCIVVKIIPLTLKCTFQFCVSKTISSCTVFAKHLLWKHYRNRYPEKNEEGEKKLYSLPFWY